MTDIALDTDGDLELSGNELVLIAGADEVTQRLRCRLRMIRGEWFLDEGRGVPFRELLWVKGTSLSRIASAIKREILTVSGVLELLSYDQIFDSAARSLTVTFQVRATDGQIVEYSEVLS